MKRPCLDCGRLIERGSYCRECERQHERRDIGRLRKTPGRSSRAQQGFRNRVIANAGYRCQHVNVYGVRCSVTGAENLTAHHLIPFQNTGSMDPRGGVALCGAHHALAEARLRACAT